MCWFISVLILCWALQKWRTDYLFIINGGVFPTLSTEYLNDIQIKCTLRWKWRILFINISIILVNDSLVAYLVWQSTHSVCFLVLLFWFPFDLYIEKTQCINVQRMYPCQMIKSWGWYELQNNRMPWVICLIISLEEGIKTSYKIHNKSYLGKMWHNAVSKAL